MDKNEWAKKNMYEKREENRSCSTVDDDNDSINVIQFDARCIGNEMQFRRQNEERKMWFEQIQNERRTGLTDCSKFDSFITHLEKDIKRNT